jgi:hypothetical protein
VEGASFIVVDTNGSNSMNSGDLIVVFANSNDGTDASINSTRGYNLEIVMRGTVVASTSLG